MASSILKNSGVQRVKSLGQPKNRGKLKGKGAGLGLGLCATTIGSDWQIITVADRLLEINEDVIFAGGSSRSIENTESIFQRWQLRSAAVEFSARQSVLVIKGGGGHSCVTNSWGPA